MSNRRTRASTIRNSLGEPTAITLLVRRSTENRSGTSKQFPSTAARPAVGEPAGTMLLSICIMLRASPFLISGKS